MKELIKNLQNINKEHNDIKYTVLTFLFGDYDILKEPEEIDNNAEYICITDRTDLQSNVWKLIYDDELNNYELGIQKSFCVKYKKIFNYISSDSKYVIRLDASIQIHKSLSTIIDYIDHNEYDCVLMIHPERRNLIDEYNRWITLRNQDPIYQDVFFNKMYEAGFNLFDTGLIETTCQIYKVCDKVKNMVNDISYIIEEASNFCDNNDQCYYTYILSKYIDDLNILYVNRQFISSDYLDLCYHYTNKPVYKNHINPYSAIDKLYLYDLNKPIRHYNLLGHDISIKYFKNDSQLNLGIFYIATGVYKEYFNKFIETIKYIFPKHNKKLIIISDGLEEYNEVHLDNIDIYVENFIDYPYPFININKFQIVNHYAEKYNIDIITYFDSETFFIEKDSKFFDDLIEKSKHKLISLIPPHFIKNSFRDFIWAMNNYTLWSEYNNFDDFSFFYDSEHYEYIDENYKWLQTSFFMCSKDILDNIEKILENLISYNLRVMGCKLNFSDEFYINYLNVYYPELFYGDFYGDNKDNKNTFSSKFFYQKTIHLNKKLIRKFGNTNYHFRLFAFNTLNENDFIRFFIEHQSKFLISGINWEYKNSKLLFNNIGLNEFWFDGNHNIILEESFYSNSFISNFNNVVNNNEYMCIGFLNQINEYSNNFDYDEFYNGKYDYIEGHSFDDLENINFSDIDMCCFSKQYIKAYFNNDTEFKPKIYKLN